MNQVAGRTAGNAVDVRESIDHLTDRRGGRFRAREGTLALSAELLRLGGVDPDTRSAGSATAGTTICATSREPLWWPHFASIRSSWR
jgi:thymidine phosphorylase